MKIAFVYDPIYPYVIGGAEKRCREFAGALVKIGHEVSLVGMKYWQGENRIFEDDIELVGVCEAVPLYGKSGTRSIFEALYFSFHVFLHLRRNSYDVVDCGNIPYLPAIAAWAALFMTGKLGRTKFVVTWHEVWGLKYWVSYAKLAGIPGWMSEYVCAKISPENIANSKFTKGRAEKILGIKPGKITVIPNAIELELFNKVPSMPKTGRIIYTGRLVKHKRVDLLIEAFSETAHAGAVLTIVGDGPEKEKLLRQAAELGVENKVEFRGFLKKDELYVLIKSSKALVIPSEREGFAIIVVEAMALGVPVAAMESEFSAVKTIITDGRDGLLFKDKEGLKQALNKLLSDEKYRAALIEEGYRTAKKYDLDSVVIPALIDYYKNI